MRAVDLVSFNYVTAVALFLFLPAFSKLVEIVVVRIAPARFGPRISQLGEAMRDWLIVIATGLGTVFMLHACATDYVAGAGT